MPTPLVLAEGVSGATQESKVDDAQTVDNSLKSAEEAKDSVVDKEQIDSNSPSQSSEKPETPTENSSIDSPSENPAANESLRSESNPESEPPKTDNSDKSTEENAPILISKISQDKKYVEIYNPTNQNVNLAGWKIEYYTGSGAKTVGKIAKTVGKIFKDEVISPNEFLVLSNDKMLAGAIKFDNNFLEMTKSGEVRSTLTFTEGENTEGYYKTPYGTFLIETDTKKLDIKIGKKNIFVNSLQKTTAYTLENIAKFAILHLISPDFLLSLGILC